MHSADNPERPPECDAAGDRLLPRAGFPAAFRRIGLAGFERRGEGMTALPRLSPPCVGYDAQTTVKNRTALSQTVRKFRVTS